MAYKYKIWKNMIFRDFIDVYAYINIYILCISCFFIFYIYNIGSLA